MMLLTTFIYKTQKKICLTFEFSCWKRGSVKRTSSVTCSLWREINRYVTRQSRVNPK